MCACPATTHPISSDRSSGICTLQQGDSNVWPEACSCMASRDSTQRKNLHSPLILSLAGKIDRGLGTHAGCELLPASQHIIGSRTQITKAEAPWTASSGNISASVGWNGSSALCDWESCVLRLWEICDYMSVGGSLRNLCEWPHMLRAP